MTDIIFRDAMQLLERIGNNRLNAHRSAVLRRTPVFYYIMLGYCRALLKSYIPSGTIQPHFLNMRAPSADWMKSMNFLARGFVIPFAVKTIPQSR